MFKTLFLDVDGTLLDFDKCEKAALYNALLENDIVCNEEMHLWYHNENTRLWREYDMGRMARDEILLQRFRNLLKHYEKPGDVEVIEKSYRDYLGKEHALMDGAIDILEYLSKKYDLYVVTNGVAASQHVRLKESGIEKYFKDIFISDEIGFQKPRIEFFDICFKKIGCIEKDSAMIIGDSLSSDIMGGINAGIKTCWLNQNGQELPSNMKIDYEIKDLSELYSIL